MLTAAVNHGVIIDVIEKKQKKLNIGIMGDKIAVLSETPLKAEHVIDASGLLVSPGFIDVHGHVDGDLYAGELCACQGITTTVGGNCGYSPADLKTFFEEQDAHGFPIHQAMLIGHGIPLRRAAGLFDPYQAGNPEQIEIMADMAEKALKDGACGISFGLDYVPGCSLEEVLALARLCKKWDRICPVHTRLLTDKDIYSLYELIFAAERTGAHILISHFVYQYCCGLVKEGLAMVDKARKRGLNLHIDSGMYTNWTTYFNTPTYDYNNIKNNNWKWEQMVVATGPYKGRVMDEELYFHMKENDPEESVILFEGEEREVFDCLQKPYAMPSTDIGAYKEGEGHPQIAGSFPRYFRKMVVEEKLLSLEEAVYKATLLPAEVFAFEKKGRILPGMDADLTIFDIRTICDKATYPHLGLPDARPEGIPYVMVGGVLAVDQGCYRNTRSGQTIRK
ncbi:MAG: amidohydrolase family protein [Blautia sp.]|jgi:N-acyl-D-aspartate/D-glutamate deacylase